MTPKLLVNTQIAANVLRHYIVRIIRMISWLIIFEWNKYMIIITFGKSLHCTLYSSPVWRFRLRKLSDVVFTRFYKMLILQIALQSLLILSLRNPVWRICLLKWRTLNVFFSTVIMIDICRCYDENIYVCINN